MPERTPGPEEPTPGPEEPVAGPEEPVAGQGELVAGQGELVAGQGELVAGGDFPGSGEPVAESDQVGESDQVDGDDQVDESDQVGGDGQVDESDQVGGDGQVEPGSVEAQLPDAGTSGAVARSGRPGRSPRLRPARPARVKKAGPRRGVILLTIAVLLVVGGLIDRAGADRQPSLASLPSVPLVAAQSALSSSWFCAGATGPAGSPAAGSLVIANPTSTAQTATVNIVASTGPGPAPILIAIPAGTRQTVPEVLPASGSWAAATVTLDGGGGAVEQELNGPLGLEVSPCATAASTSWYLPSGTTLRNADEVVSLYNPYPADAIVDLSFVTDQGPEAPEDFQAITVPGESVVPVDLATHLRRRATIATSVSARTGRIVAWKTEIITPPAPGTPIVGQAVPAGSVALNDPAPAVGGVSSTLGAASLSPTWYWPDGVAGNGVDEDYVVFNPGSATAELRLSLTLESGESESFPLTVGPQSVATVSTSQQIRIPPGIAHDATLTSTNGVPVVAERSVTAASPSLRNGTGELIGEEIAARTWVLAAGATPATLEYIELQNPGTVTVRAMVESTGVFGPTPIAGLTDLLVPGGGRVAIHLTGSELAAAVKGPLLVTGNGPMVVERDLYGNSTSESSGLGISLALGAPDLNAL